MFASATQGGHNEQITHNRLWIGHTTITHSYVVDHQDFPECNNCNKLLTVKHILTECTIMVTHCPHKYCSHSNTDELFKHLSCKNVMHFVISLNLYDKF